MTALELIAAERKRQIEVEGWTPEHDAQVHDNGELALAAACYSTHPLKIYYRMEYAKSYHFEQLIPFDEYHVDDKHSELKRMVIAGALIVAEIERLTLTGKNEMK